ncbi:unnamed protein product [Caretta caretta]
MGMRSSPNPPQQPPPSSPWGFLRNGPAPCLDCWGSRGAQWQLRIQKPVPAAAGVPRETLPKAAGDWEMAPGSGAFEVLLPDSGEVLHSKINGDGYVDSNAKVQRICEGISKVLKQ